MENSFLITKCMLRPNEGSSLKEYYDIGRKERKRLGSLGAKFCRENQMTAIVMGENFIKSMDGGFENWKPRKKYSMVKV